MKQASYPTSLLEAIVEAYEKYGLTQTDIFFLCIRARNRTDLSTRMPCYVTREGLQRMIDGGFLYYVIPGISKENYEEWTNRTSNLFNEFTDLDLTDKAYQLIGENGRDSRFEELFKIYPFTNSHGMNLKALNEEEYKRTEQEYLALLDKSDNEYLHQAYISIIAKNSDHPLLNIRIDKFVRNGYLVQLYDETKGDDYTGTRI